MGFLSLFFPWGVLLQVAALVHFIRRRPDGVWLWIILFFGPIGAGVYIALEVVPDLTLLRQSFEGYRRRKRVSYLEALVQQNPAAGNFEELGDLYLEQQDYAKAKACYDRAISPRVNDVGPFYGRGVAEVHLGDYPNAVRDLEIVVGQDPKHDFHRAMALLGHAYARTGEPARADAAFLRATELSTLSETYYNYGVFLADQGRTAEAREWAERILSKKSTLPRYLRRRERPWFRQAAALMKRLPRE